jgi:hypothetical protein
VSKLIPALPSRWSLPNSSILVNIVSPVMAGAPYGGLISS